MEGFVLATIQGSRVGHGGGGLAGTRGGQTHCICSQTGDRARLHQTWRPLSDTSSSEAPPLKCPAAFRNSTASGGQCSNTGACGRRFTFRPGHRSAVSVFWSHGIPPMCLQTHFLLGTLATLAQEFTVLHPDAILTSQACRTVFPSRILRSLFLRDTVQSLRLAFCLSCGRPGV